MSIIHGEKPDVIGFQETKSGLVDNFSVEEVWGNRNFGFTQIEAKGRSGGMLLIWETNVFNCFDAMGDDRFIALKGGWKGVSRNIVLVCLYGPHVSKEKSSLWDRLTGLLRNSSKDWCIFGEFSMVRRQKDILNSQINVKEMEDFNNFINITRLVEIPLGGRKFTWISDDVASDRKFSDHCPIVLKDMYVDFVGAMGWELEAKSRALDDDERLKWLEARHLWIGEVHNAFIGDMFILDDILITNETVDFVKKNKSKERGVRQGDPLSPFLFILAAEGLNSMIKEAVQKDIFKGIKVGAERVVVSHL
ncbi:RNA-directed DNA polymerase, eukaryota [Tanacetum coccineum]